MIKKVDTANPKHAMGAAKVPLHLWPDVASIYGSIGLYEGFLKYGRSNFRGTKVYASIYIAAMKRHLARYMEGGELTDIGHILANCAIILDAHHNKTLIDDRNFVTKDADSIDKVCDELTPVMRNLEKLYGKRNPKHFSRLDK